MNGRRAIAAAGVCVALCLAVFGFEAVPAGAVAEPPAGEAGWMYDAGTVVAIDLELSQEKREELEDEPDEYVKGTFSLSKTNGTPGGPKTPVVTSLPVEVKLKGNVLGSFRTLDKKAAFKFKFGKKEPFLGLRKMTLNNMVEDYSSIHEALAYRVFRAAGIAAPRTGFAWLRLNGEGFGLYLNLENLDKVNLERWFGPFQEPPQHLYEGEDGTDVTPGVDALAPDKGGYEVDEGDKEHLDDLKALVAAVNSGTGAGWLGRVAPSADLVEMTRMWAVEKYIGHWDGYSGEEGALKPNNYYLYSDRSGSFQMLPWGTDNTWEPFRRPSFDGDAGLMFNDCLTDPSCAPLYRQALRDLRGMIASLGLDSLAVQTAGLLEPWEQQEQALTRHEHSMSQIETGVSETREFIADRPAELAALLGPEQGPPHPKTVIASFPPPPGFYVGHAWRAGTALLTHLWLPGSGVVSQTATIKTAHGSRDACSAKASVGRSGPLNLRCSLSSTALSRLRSRPVGLRVQTSFVPQVGSRELRVRHVNLARFGAP